jgi:palmitoyltransferase
MESRPDQSGAVTFDFGGERFEGMNPQVKALMTYRSKTTENLKTFWARHCLICNDVKPARTHHCRACNRCVFRMDHHCPWVNNCLGNENLRYFLLFTFYLMLGALWYALTIMSIWDHHIYMEHHSDLSFLFLLNSTLGACLVFWNLWNWKLASVGMTTLEFWRRATESIEELESQFEYQLPTTGDNLFLIFGT